MDDANPTARRGRADAHPRGGYLRRTGSFLRQEARSYNQKAEKAEKLYEKLPTKFLLAQPDMYEGI